MLFKPELLEKVLQGHKTQTRRTNGNNLHPGQTYGVRTNYYEKSRGHIRILRATQQRLGDISLEEVQKEGFKNIWEFREAWLKIYLRWNPDEVVTAYEFEVVKGTPLRTPSS